MDFEATFIGRPGTIRTYTSLFRKWIKPHDLTLVERKHQWDQAGLSPRTQKILLRIAREYDEWKGNINSADTAAKLRNLINKNVQPDPPKALSLNDAKLLIDKWEELYPTHSGLVLLGIHTGMRIGELRGLQWNDIDVLKGEIHVMRSRTNGKDGPTKNGRGRIIPMSKQVEDSLLKRYNYTEDNTKVFTCSDINAKLQRCCTKAGIQPITFHALRHTFATLALESGQSIKTVSETLGHSQVSTTINIYWNIVNKKLDLGFLE